jgi:hypothetical protein
MPKQIISDPEAQRRQRQRAAAQLLYDRATTAHLLGDISTSTLIRLEKTKQLVVVKPSGRNGKTFYTSQSVRRLAGCEQVTEVA